MSQKQAKVSAYKLANRYAINRKMKLERHLRKHPEDAQAVAALKANRQTPLRKTPKAKLGWLANAAGAKIVSRFIGQPRKQAAKSLAGILSFVGKQQFMLSPVLVAGADNSTYIVWKHMSKKSNFTEVKDDGSVVVHA